MIPETKGLPTVRIFRTVRYYASYVSRLARDAVRHRAVYASATEACKSFALGVATTGAGRRLMSGSVCHLKLRGYPDPIRLRVSSSDMLVAKEIFEFGEYRRVEQFNVGGSPTVIDLGGNIGLASIYFSTVFPHCRVITVEPDAQNFDLLQENCGRLISAGRMNAVRAFVGGEAGFAGIDRSQDHWGIRMAAGNAPSEERIACVTVDSLLDRFSILTVDILKCDIEGSEAKVFKSCAPWINRIHYLIVETHPPYGPDELYRDLRQAGWSFRVLSEQGTPLTVCALERYPADTSNASAPGPPLGAALPPI